MNHPNFLDRLALRIYPRYLYPQQLAVTVAKVNVGVVHKIPQTPPYWKIMDYLFILKGSQLRYLGLARDLKLTGDVEPLYSLFELIHPIAEDNLDHDAKHTTTGDLVCVTPADRKYIYPSPEVSAPTNPYITHP